MMRFYSAAAGATESHKSTGGQTDRLVVHVGPTETDAEGSATALRNHLIPQRASQARRQAELANRQPLATVVRPT